MVALLGVGECILRGGLDADTVSPRGGVGGTKVDVTEGLGVCCRRFSGTSLAEVIRSAGIAGTGGTFDSSMAGSCEAVELLDAVDALEALDLPKKDRSPRRVAISPTVLFPSCGYSSIGVS